MLFTTASSEVPLLIFSLLVPMSVIAIGLMALVRATATGTEADHGKRTDIMMTIPAVLIFVGLFAATQHVGSPSHMFGMVNGLGRSPLSNEILCAGIAAAAAIVYWIYALVKHPGTGAHKIWGIIITILGVIAAIMTGLAYMIDTLPTWNTAWSWVGQLGNSLVAGAALAAMCLAFSDYDEARKGTSCLQIIGVVGAVLGIIAVFAQGSIAAGMVSSAGATVTAAMSQYWTCAWVATILMILGIVAWGLGVCRNKQKKVLTCVAFILIIAAYVFLRICFYGIFLNVGIF